MDNNKDPNKKRPGEKTPGTFHYNPGNMAGKKIGVKDEVQREAERKRREQQEQEQKR
jgi:hypothetical protein